MIPRLPDPPARFVAVSPAGPVGEEEVRRGADVLREEGYEVLRGTHALRQGQYLAGTDAQRAGDLQRAFEDDAVDAIICTRGGYGSMRLLPLLDFAAIARNPKPFIGFSDITALQWALFDRAGLVSFSGVQLARGFGGELPPFSYDSFFSALRGELWGRPLPMPEDRAQLQVHRNSGPDKVAGSLLGGNLAVLAALAGTPHAVRFGGAIALLEEIDEPHYRIDRTLTQLEQSGAFAGVRAVVLGSFAQHVKGERTEWASLAAEILASALPGVPIARGLPYGHVGPLLTLPIGAQAELDLRRGTMTIREETA